MILLILLIIFQSTSVPTYASNNQTYYAKILFDQTYLYKTYEVSENVNNIYFELPKTYFVELISLHGNYYKAKYLDVIGYVKKDSVQAVANTPQNPFLKTVTFRVYANMSQSMYAQPSKSGNLITEIPLLTKNILFVGKIEGECLIEGRTNIWYYCKYSTDQDYYGYVYSDFCDEMQEIPINTEDVQYVDNPTFEIVKNTNSIPLENKTTIGIVVTILTIPALIFVLMILNGSKILSNNKPKSKEIVDY